MHTSYVPPTQFDGDIVTITGDEHHHLRNVRRVRPGENIRLINGKGTVYIAKVLDTATADVTQAEILSAEFRTPRLPSLTLFQGVPKHDKMELILQKTTELGVTQIIPMHSERSLQKPSQQRCERWQRVVVSATKQCKRAWLPELSSPQQFETCLAQVKRFTRSLICCESVTEQHIKTVLRHGQGTMTCATTERYLALREKREGQAPNSLDSPKPESISIFIGPEGGFAVEEVNAAIENGCIPVTLGQNILRTETAAIAAVAAVAYELSDQTLNNR